MVTQIDNRRLHEFEEIVSHEMLTTVFQPIVSLKDGSVYAYEALSRITKADVGFNIQELFEFADYNNRENELEKICRCKAIVAAKRKKSGIKLFLNCGVNVISQPELIKEFDKENLKEYELAHSEIVFEVTEIGLLKNKDSFHKSLNYYRMQNMKVAIDDFGDGYSSIARICEVQPEFIKVDISMVRDIDKSEWKYSALKALCSYCKKRETKLIAEGIETKEELEILISLGIHYGQGYYLGKPNKDFIGVKEDVKQLIKSYYKKYKGKVVGGALFSFAQNIAQRGIVFTCNTPVSEIYQVIMDDLFITDISIIDDSLKVKGIITRNRVLDEFANESDILGSEKVAADIMDSDILCVDENLSLIKLLKMAMNREDNRLYDSIMVKNEDDIYVGIISIKKLFSALKHN